MGLNMLAQTWRALNGDHRSAGWGCPDEAALAAYADGRCEEKRRLAAESHLAKCVHCRKQVAFLLREDCRESSSEVPQYLLARGCEVVPERLPAAKPLWWATAAGASACLLFLAVLAMRIPTVPIAFPPPAVPMLVQEASPLAKASIKAVPGATIRAKTQPVNRPDLVQPSEGASVSSERVEFRWRPLRACLFYELRVTAADGELLFNERTEATHLRLPQGVSLRPGEVHFAWVAAHLREGKTVKAKAVPFRVEGPRE